MKGELVIYVNTQGKCQGKNIISCDFCPLTSEF